MITIKKKQVTKNERTFYNYSVVYTLSSGRNVLLLPYVKYDDPELLAKRRQLTDLIVNDFIAKGGVVVEE